MSTKPEPVVHIHTHYDNLKIARDAPPEVIRAAYKTLSQKFHPDRNSNKEESTRTFQIINSAYEVLSDPVRRKEHDEWILATEAKNHSLENGENPAFSPSMPEKDTSKHSWERGKLIKYATQYRDRTFSNVRMLLRGQLDKRQAFNYLLWSVIAALIIFIILVS
jgi:curved DNA-binding protein CbpA